MKISIVVPLYNETENLDEFYTRIKNVINLSGLACELIFVNDGSRDNTLEHAKHLHANDPTVKIINLSRNFGKEIALSAGLDYTTGDAVVVIDADLQEPPELIPEMVKKWQEGFDVVYAVRKKRGREPLIKTLSAYLFYRVMKKISRVEIPVDTGDYRLMSRRAVDALIRVREQHRFMKGLFAWIGYKQTGIYYEREERHGGSTSFSLWRLWNFAVDGITSFSFVPLQLSSLIGLIIASFSVLFAFYILIETLIFGNAVPGYPSLMVAVLFLGGVQLISIGIIGEYIARIYGESKQRPLYFVQDFIGFEKEREHKN